MKLDQLRQIIREEVRAAVKEELQDMLNEAVKIASTPDTKPSLGYTPVPKGQPKKWSTGRSATLEEMLAVTKQQMTGQDFNDVLGYQRPNAPNFATQNAVKLGLNETPLPGIDITKLPFMNKAKAILDASIQKDKERHGL